MNRQQSKPENKEYINLQKLYPNWEFATDHGKASLPGKQSDSGVNTFCPCCLNVIQKQPISLWENSKQLFFLGHGFPLFYNMLQFCIMLIFMLIITESTLTLYFDVQQDCLTKLGPLHSRLLANSNNNEKLQVNACTSAFVLLSQSSYILTDAQAIGRIMSFVGALAMLLYFRDNQRKLAGYHKQRNYKISDFCIILKNLPKQPKIKATLKRFMKSIFNIEIEYQSIILFPESEEFLQAQKEKEKIIEQQKKLIDQKNTNKKQIHLIQNQIKLINKKITKICERMANLEENDSLISQKAVIILENQKMRVQTIEQFNKINKQILIEYFGDNAFQISLKTAPEPGQIIWENINYPKNKRWFKILLGWGLFILFLGPLIVGFYFLLVLKAGIIEHLQQASHDSIQHTQATIIVFVTMFLIQLFNKFVMKFVLHKLGELEKPQTSSQMQFSYAFKYTLGMFFTTAILTLAVEAIKFGNYTGQFGVVEEETIIFFFNGFFVNLLWIAHPQYYIRKIRRYFMKGKENLTQLQANQLMEDYPYDMGKRYAQILQTMWFTYLYSSLIPIGAFITFIGLVIYYWVDKYNLLRRSKLDKQIQSKLPMNAITLLQMILIWKPLGDLIFDLQLRQYVYPSTITMLVIGGVYMFIPWNIVLTFLFHQKFKLKRQNYKQVEHMFNQSYRTQNPIQRHLNIQKFLRKKNEGGTLVSTQIKGYLQQIKDLPSNSKDNILKQFEQDLYPQTSKNTLRSQAQIILGNDRFQD